jgi:pimeloyl-ACP methyl ester carboxylesterase
MSETTTLPEQRSRLRHVLAILALRDVPFWTCSLWRRVLRVPIFIVYVNVIMLAILLPLENRLLFPGWSFGGEWVAPADALHIQEIELTTADGTTIYAWFMAPPDWKPSSGAILYSHGNGGNLSWRQNTMAGWQLELQRAVLIYDYPGYGKSGGKPTEAGCYAAAEAAFTWLVETQKVPGREIILLGSSLGGAMATELATRHDHRLLVLIGSFTSVPDMAQKTIFWLPTRWLVSNRMDNLAKIDQVCGPVFIAHGTADKVVPYWMGEKLYENAREPKCFFRMDNHPHQHPTMPEFYEAVRRFLDETSPAARDRPAVNDRPKPPKAG